jgi:hypothetical protein
MSDRAHFVSRDAEELSEARKRIAELEALARQANHERLVIQKLSERNIRLRAALESAETALKFYGHHTQNCTVRVYRDIAEIEPEVRPACSCNYSARVAEIAKALEAGDE